MDQEMAAESIIKSHVLTSMGAGLIPIPVVDFVAVTAIQVDLLKQLCELYGISYYENSGKGMITALTGSSLARIGASVFKAIPGVGSLFGGLSMSILSGVSTYAIGRVFSMHFANGGDFSNFDPATAKQFYEEEMERGKEIVENWKKEREAQKERDAQADRQDKREAEEDIYEKLERLGDLKKKGVLSEEEFQKMKEKLLSELS